MSEIRLVLVSQDAHYFEQLANMRFEELVNDGFKFHSASPIEVTEIKDPESYRGYRTKYTQSFVLIKEDEK